MLDRDTLAATFGGNELRYLDVGDQRRKARGMLMLNQFCDHPEQNLPETMGSAAATQAASRWLRHPKVTASAVRQAHRDRTLDRIRPLPAILIVQDTTQLDQTTHPATTGLGPLSAVTHQGLHVHTALAFTPTGVPLGVLAQQVWARDPATRGQAKRRRSRAQGEKESRRWSETLTASHDDVPAHVHTITIADREADIYALFAHARPKQADLLIRAAHNRAIAEPEVGYLLEAVRATAIRGFLEITVPRKASQPARTARLALRWTPATMLPPQRGKGAGVRVWVVQAVELQPPPGVPPIEWLLLATYPVTTCAQAKQCVRFYTQRWPIEQFHYTLKSGCTIERLQVETADALDKALALYNIVAWRYLHLTALARQQPAAPCTVAFTAPEWRLVYAWYHRQAPCPETPPPLATIVRLVARLGGYLDRKCDGPPGVTVLWRGLRRLAELVADCDFAWQLHPPGPPAPPPGANRTCVQ